MLGKSFINQKVNWKLYTLLALVLMLCGCVTKPPPADINNICRIFKQYPSWYADAKDVERRWKVPIPIQMAIIHQESKFDARNKPPRKKLLWVVPWVRQSTASGYSQALNSTWSLYKRSNGSLMSSRASFTDGVDFIGWYANMAYVKARVPRTDPYLLYLAYHEGIGGYNRKTYLNKPWLISVAHKVRAKASLYSMQLNSCKASLKSHGWF